MSNNKSRSLNKCFHCSQITGQVVLGDGLFFCYHCSKPYAGEDDNKDEEEELVLLQPSRDVVPVSSERSGANDSEDRSAAQQSNARKTRQEEMQAETRKSNEYQATR